jgi:hypothetical protein
MFKGYWVCFCVVGDDDSGPEDVRMMRILSALLAFDFQMLAKSPPKMLSGN